MVEEPIVIRKRPKKIPFKEIHGHNRISYGEGSNSWEQAEADFDEEL